MSDEVISIYMEYASGKIKLRDIPFDKLNKMILIKASLLEPNELPNVILELYKNNMFSSLNLNLTVVLSLIQEEYKNKGFYDKLFMINPNELFLHIPKEYRSKEMCNKFLELNPLFDDFELIPIEFRTKVMWDKILINSDNIDVFKDIPLEYIDQQLCDMAIEKFGVSVFEYIPDIFKTYKMCEMASRNTDDWKVFFKIPRNLLTQDICNNIFNVSLIQDDMLDCFKNIPLEYRSISMCKKMIEYCDNSDVLKLIPKDKLTDIICDMALNKYSDSSIEYMPIELKTKEFYIRLLEKDFEKYIKYVPSKYYDLELYAIIVMELRKFLKKKKTIEMNRVLCLEIIKEHPELIKVFSSEMRNEIIKSELISLISNGGTLNYISKIYDLSIDDINNVLEGMKESNLEKYNAIKKVLHDNQQRYYFTMLEDIENLYNIILLFDHLEVDVINTKQKIMFAYLYDRCIFNSLEEIYDFNIKNSFLNSDSMGIQERTLYFMMSSRIIQFFKKHFKYNYALGDGVSNIDVIEKKNILLSNVWLRKYNRDNYIKMENGKQVITRKYGKNEDILTVEIEEYIVNKLKQNNIPLIDIIVSNAFREYFNGNLDEYIIKLCEYESYVYDIKSKRSNSKNR